MNQFLEQSVCLFAVSDKEAENGLKLVIINKDHRYWMDDNAIFIDNIVVRFPIAKSIDMQELRLKAIETLKDKQRKARLDAAEKIAALQVKIDQLLLLEYKPIPEEAELF